MQIEPNAKVALFLKDGENLIPLIETTADENGDVDLSLTKEHLKLMLPDSAEKPVVVQMRSPVTPIKIQPKKNVEPDADAAEKIRNSFPGIEWCTTNDGAQFFCDLKSMPDHEYRLQFAWSWWDGAWLVDLDDDGVYDGACLIRERFDLLDDAIAFLKKRIALIVSELSLLT